MLVSTYRNNSWHIEELNVVIGSFGIGTSLTNDFRSLTKEEKSKALNMVIKLVEVNGEPCIKISDELTKVSTPKSTCHLLRV